MATENKFAKALKRTGDFIKENPKPIAYIGGSIIAVIVIAAVVKGVKGGISSFFNPNKNIVGGKFNKQEVDKSKTSISELTAKNYAESLFESFNYTWGTDKSVIESIFSKINSEDFKLIYNEFGKRSYSDINSGTPSGKVYALDTYIGNVNLDLVQWLNKELGLGDGSLKNKIRPIVDGAGFVLEK